MIDIVVVALIALLALRGWYRGFVIEALDLVGLLVGVFLAFRLGPAVGFVVRGMTGASDAVGRFVGGVIVLIGVGVGSAVLARMLQRRVRLPGLNMINRASGAGLAMAWGTFLATVVLSLAVILPVPPAVADQLDDSALTSILTEPEGAPQQVFGTLAGDRVVQALISLRDVFGSRRIVAADAVVEFPAADAARLRRDPEAADRIFTLTNLARVEAGEDPVAWSPALSEVAYSHAADMYTSGQFSHYSERTGYLPERLADAGIVYVSAGENLALAASADEAHDGLMESPGHRRNILAADYRRMGVAVVDGPYGLMVVQVFSG